MAAPTCWRQSFCRRRFPFCRRHRPPLQVPVDRLGRPSCDQEPCRDTVPGTQPESSVSYFATGRQHIGRQCTFYEAGASLSRSHTSRNNKILLLSPRVWKHPGPEKNTNVNNNDLRCKDMSPHASWHGHARWPASFSCHPPRS